MVTNVEDTPTALQKWRKLEASRLVVGRVIQRKPPREKVFEMRSEAAAKPAMPRVAGGCQELGTAGERTYELSICCLSSTHCMA